VPRAEDLPGRGQDDRAELLVVPDTAEAIEELSHESQRESVALAGTIQRHDGDGAVCLEAKVLVSHLVT